MGGPSSPHCDSGQLLWPSPMKISTNNSKFGITILGDISISVIWKGFSHSQMETIWIIMESSPISKQLSIIWVGENL